MIGRGWEIERLIVQLYCWLEKWERILKEAERANTENTEISGGSLESGSRSCCLVARLLTRRLLSASWES